MNNFKIGDVVLFCCNPGRQTWKKGRIVANNFAMCNLPDFFGKPYYYITLIDERDNMENNDQTYVVEVDHKFLVKFEPGMEWCIGKDSSYWPHVINNEKTADEDYKRWKKQFKNVSKADYLEIPGLKEMFDDEQKWKESIEKKLDDINNKLNILLLSQKTWTDPLPTYPWTPGTPSSPWYDINKVYCDNDPIPFNHVYTSSIPLEEQHKYQERCSNSTDADFDCKNYTEINNTRMESTMFGNEVLDDKYDTWGLAAASKKINNNNQNKK